MKKIVSILMVIGLLLGCVGCNNTMTNSLSGEYEYVGFISPDRLINDFDNSSDIVIEVEAKSNENITYTFYSFGQKGKSGKGRLDGEHLELNGDYLYKNDCIIRYDALVEKIEYIDGKLPDSNKTSDCSIKIDADFLDGYFIDFFADGSCEIEAESSEGTYFFEGNYKVKDNIFMIELETCLYESLYSKDVEKSGLLKIALYVEGKKVYKGIYERKK